MRKIYKCFISSTFEDLKEVRLRVIEAILDARQLPAGMENFNASNKSQWDYIRMMLKDCDYFIVIVAHRYGSVDEGGMSYTEKETRYALAQGIPVLAFIIQDNAEWPHAGYENDPDKEVRLRQFKTFLAADKLVKFWTDKHDLAAKVTSALHEVISTHPRPGYIRGNLSDMPDAGQHSRRQPEFAVEFEGRQEIKIDLSQIHIVEEAPLLEYEHEIAHCQPEQFGISDNDVSIWNHSVKGYNEEIDEYNAQAEEYNRRFAAIPLPFTVSNTGTLRANNVTVTIDFPEWLEVLDGEERLKKPRKPDIPQNPVKAAMSRLKEREGIAGIRSKRGIVTSFMGLAPIQEPMFTFAHLKPLTHRKERLIIRSAHVAEYKTESLQHRLCLKCDTLRILPYDKKTMSGTVKINCMCDELSEPQFIEIPIIMDWFTGV